MGSKMSGMVKDYKKMYTIIENWNESPSNSNAQGHYLYGMGYAISDAPYFGFTGDELDNERFYYHNVEQKYKEFKNALKEAIGDK
ncbi:hypothetical protein LXJ15735_27610 [Lacrimispora xylanolytica]